MKAVCTTKRLVLHVVALLNSFGMAYLFPHYNTVQRTGPNALLPNQTRTRMRPGSLHMSSADGEGGDQEMQSLLNSLKKRQAELEDAEASKANAIRFANVESRVAVALDDWVRRIGVDYPLVACGTASGSVYLVHLENGKVLGKTEAPSGGSMIANERLEHVLHQLYGQFDGGGTLAVAVQGDILCAAHRSGGISLYRLIRSNNDNSSIQIIFQGILAKDQLVTTLQLKGDYLIAGTDRGQVHVYEIEDDLPLKNTPDICWNISGKPVIISLDVNEERGLIAVATDFGTIELFLIDNPSEPIGSFTPPYDSTERRSQNSFPTCVSFVKCSVAPVCEQNDTMGSRDTALAICCGSNDGSLFLKYLAFESTDDVFDDTTIATLMPRHFAGVKCLASPTKDLLISGGLDGSLRIWDVKERRFLYQFMGYKVWLGSLWTDGFRLCSDGSDNTVVMHDYTAGTKL